MGSDDELRARVAKLPGWAQALIQDIERDCKSAKKRLADFLDDQTEGPLYTDESLYEQPYRQRRRFIQASMIKCQIGDVVVCVRPFGDPAGVEVHVESNLGAVDCAILPRASNTFTIIGVNRKEVPRET